METSKIEQAKNKILETLSHMDFSAEIYERQEEGRLVFNIKCQDAKLLIGKQGNTLESLQHICRILVGRLLQDETFPMAIDVDDYKEKRVIYLKELARKAAHQVRESKRPVSLVPMPSYERRVVHNYLSLYSDIQSSSIGEDPNRKIIIRPKEKTKDDFSFVENL